MKKISIGAQIVEGPFGGGNKFLENLVKYLKENSFQVVDNLIDDDIDLILLVSPLITSTIATFDHIDVFHYVNNRNPNTVTIQRINECDERKNTNHVNKKIITSNEYIDISVFVSDWLKNLFVEQGLKSKEIFVVKGGPDGTIFNIGNKNKWDKKNKIKIVTHHWSNNWMKGFDSYAKLDSLISDKNWNSKIEFTYIGNLPQNFKFKNTKVIQPLTDVQLSNELKKHDIYITGSINEPSGNHHMEAAMCGLPILYINSGGIPEYCEKYGVEFEIDNLEKKLKEIIYDYDKYYLRLQKYPYNFEYAAKTFLEIFNNAIENKNKYLLLRKRKSRLIVLNIYLINKIYKNLYFFYVNIRKKLGMLKKRNW